jgi:hypothetical protein
VLGAAATALAQHHALWGGPCAGASLPGSEGNSRCSKIARPPLGAGRVEGRRGGVQAALGRIRRFQLRARLERAITPSRPPPLRTGQAVFPHPALRVSFIGPPSVVPSHPMPMGTDPIVGAGLHWSIVHTFPQVCHDVSTATSAVCFGASILSYP